MEESIGAACCLESGPTEEESTRLADPSTEVLELHHSTSQLDGLGGM